VDDIDILRLENKALRFQNQQLQKTVNEMFLKERQLADELHFLRRFRQLVERGAQIVGKLPASLFTT